MKKILVSLLIIFIFTDITQGQNLSNRDITTIKKFIRHSRIIGFGEEEHYYQESNRNRIEIIKRLIKDGLINCIVFENPSTDAFLINEYIHSRIDKSSLLKSLEELKAHNGGPFFDSKEIFLFIEWLKNENQKKHAIDVYGMDFYNYITAIENIQEISKQKGLQNNLNKIKQTLDTLTDLLHNNITGLLSNEVKNLSSENLFMVKQFISKIDTSLSIKVKWSVNDLYNYSYWFTDLNNRDSLMFQNFTKIDEGNKNYLIWAANFHIQNDSLAMPGSTSNLFGNLMTKKYREQYFKIGVVSTSACGQDNSKRVILPVASCNYKNKLDLIVLIQKGNKTTSIFDK